jgi:hypothetical protein
MAHAPAPVEEDAEAASAGEAGADEEPAAKAADANNASAPE